MNNYSIHKIQLVELATQTSSLFQSSCFGCFPTLSLVISNKNGNLTNTNNYDSNLQFILIILAQVSSSYLISN